MRRKQEDTVKGRTVPVARGLDGFDTGSTPKGSDSDPSHTDASVYRFTPKHHLSVKNNPLCGICFTPWLGIIWDRWRDIDWLTYWPRLLFVTIMSVINSALALVETILYHRAIEAAEVEPRPVFILGHPRTGTTLLHGLLALDERRFTFCSTFCAGFPSSFLWFEALGKRLFAGVIDKTRPMDNMTLHFDIPQEDELATNLLSGGVSGYLPIWFMRAEPRVRALYAMRAAPAGLRARWTAAFLHLLKKLAVRSARTEGGGPQRRVLLKSPVHTARVALLRQLFPEAQFLYIHRHPYEVFQSACHMADTTYWYTYLATPSSAQIQEFILKQYEILWEEYEAARRDLPPGSLLEVSFQELTEDPLATVKGIYTHFGWDGWDAVEPVIKEYCEDITGYQRNRFDCLRTDLKEEVYRRWGSSFSRLGYAP